MTYIPDVRKKINSPLYKNIGKPEGNPYYEGYLSEDLASSVVGYDEAVDVVNNCFYNLDMFLEIFEAIGININRFERFLSGYSDNIKDWENVDITDLSDEQLESLDPVVRFILGIRMIMLNYLEMQRNDFVVSLFDSMPEEEYEKMKKRVDEEGYKNEVLRMQDFSDKRDEGFIEKPY